MSLGGSTEIVWLGHATFLFRLPSGEVVVYDPWLGNPKCPARFHELPRVDLLLATHGHTDHVRDLVRLAQQHRARIVCIADMAYWLAKQGIPDQQIVDMNKGGTASVLPGLTVTMVHADHSSSYPGADGLPIYLGEASGYILRFAGMPTIYAAGDTALFSDMKLLGELYRPEVAILPIGGHYTMDPAAAAYAARFVGVKKVIPCHYGTFPLLAGTPQQLRAALGPEIDVIETEPGQILP